MRRLLVAWFSAATLGADYTGSCPCCTLGLTAAYVSILSCLWPLVDHASGARGSHQAAEVPGACATQWLGGSSTVEAASNA